MSDESELKGVPAKRAYTKLNDGEFLGGVLDFEVTNIIAIEFEGFSPWGAGDTRHFEVDRHEIGSPDMVGEVC